MQKIRGNREPIPSAEIAPEEWLGTNLIQTIKVSSEDPTYPIENIFDPNDERGWRAGEPGQQCIRILFSEPVHLRHIQLEFVEPSVERTHEFVLRWTDSEQRELRDIVRQRWNFSPRGSTREREDFSVDLNHVVLLELLINPDVSNPKATASLAHLRIR